MNMKKAMGIATGFGLLFVIELFVYFQTGMSEALSGTGLAMVTAYKFLWLTAATAALALLAPVGAFIEGMTEKPNSGCSWWVALAGVVMIIYSALSFMNAPKTIAPSPAAVSPIPGPPSTIPTMPLPPAAPPPTPAPQATGPKISESVELAGTKIEQAEPDVIKVTMEFKNKTQKAVTELDYTFGFVDGTRLLMRLNMREGVYIPGGITGETSLTWKKANFKTPEEFQQLSDSNAKKTLKVMATPTRAAFDDGSVAGQ